MYIISHLQISAAAVFTAPIQFVLQGCSCGPDSIIIIKCHHILPQICPVFLMVLLLSFVHGQPIRHFLPLFPYVTKTFNLLGCHNILPDSPISKLGFKNVYFLCPEVGTNLFFCELTSCSTETYCIDDLVPKSEIQTIMSINTMSSSHTSMYTMNE